MKTTIDLNGRIVIPKIMRKSLGIINKETELIIEIKDDTIIITKAKITA